MRKRNVMIRITAILSVLLLIFLYLILYFFPAVKDINRLKREVKNTRLKIEEFVEIERRFSFPDKKERKYFAKAEREFERKVPRVRGKGELARLIRSISGYFSGLAEKEGVANLSLKSELDEPAVNVRDNLKYRRMYMSFSGDLKKGLNFINHIPRCDSYLTADRITLSTREDSLLFSTVVKIYYFAGPAAGSKHGREYEAGLEIDFDSEVLLERVYHNISEGFPKTELPPEFGTFGKNK
ncbi:MAG: hypothetical protein KAT34_16290 [Candidatus Aminicenantes bacterium]|nr:hypothetical protein [Candidatus Aminicenantes bacterium]